MQEKIALRKTLRKIAAVGTSLALVGVTVSGALAAGLGDLPSPFTNKVAETVVVVGSTTDDAAAQDVIAALGGMSSTPSDTPSGSVGMLTLDDFEEGERKDIDVGTSLSESTAFTGQLDETDDAGLVDGEVTIDIADSARTNYDYHEILWFGTGVNLTTALHESEEDLGSDVVLRVPQQKFGYSLVLEEDVEFGNRLVNASNSNTVSLPFLGQNIVVTGSTNTSITAYAGQLYELKRGDTVTGVCGGKTVKVTSIDTDGAFFDVDGTIEGINEDQRERVNGCEIYVDNAINSDEDANDAVLVVIQQGATGEAVDTYTTGNEYIGEDENNYLWEWNISGTDSPRWTALGLSLHESLASDEEGEFESEIMNLGLLKENKSYIAEGGGYLCLPNFYSCLVLEGPDGDFTWYDVDIKGGESEPLYTNTTTSTYASSAKTIEIKSNYQNDKGFTMRSALATTPADLSDTDTIWLYWNSSNSETTGAGNYTGVQVLYADRNTNRAVLTDLDGDSAASDAVQDLIRAENGSRTFARFDMGDFTAGLTLNVSNSTAGFVTTGFGINVTLASMRTTGSNITFFANATANGFEYLGDAKGRDTLRTLAGGPSGNIAGWDTDVRDIDGRILKDPEGNLDNDQVKISVPDDDDFEYWVRVAKPKEGVVSTTGGVSSVASSLKMMASEVTNPQTLGKNVVAVGGPAVNEVTAKLLGVTFPTYGSQLTGLDANTAMLKLMPLTSGKKALLVYGWEADDTRRAAIVVKNAAQFKSDLEGKDSVVVRGTDLTVQGITVGA